MYWLATSLRSWRLINNSNQDSVTTWLIPWLKGWHHWPLGVSPLIFPNPLLLSTSAMALPVPKAWGAAHQWILNMAPTSLLARKFGGWTFQNYSMLIHVKTGGQKISTPCSMTFGFKARGMWDTCHQRLIFLFFKEERGKRLKWPSAWFYDST